MILKLLVLIPSRLVGAEWRRRNRWGYLQGCDATWELAALGLSENCNGTKYRTSTANGKVQPDDFCGALRDT